MPIKRKLTLVILFILIASVSFSFAIHFSLQNYRQALQNTTISTLIVQEVFERRLLADEYLTTQVERAKTQWFNKHAALKQLLATNAGKFQTPVEKELVEEMIDSMASSEKTFRLLVQLYEEESVATETSLLREKNARLSSQLSLKAQETIAAASSLAVINKNKVENNLEQIVILFSSAAGLFFALLIISFWIIWKSASQIEQSNERFKFVSQATNDAIYDWDLKTNALWFGDSMYKLFGYKKGQIKETLEWWTSQLHPEDVERINKQLDDALKSTQSYFRLEYRFKKPDGNYAEIIDKAYLVRNTNAKPIRYIGVMQDISKQKSFEAELQSRTDEAERLNKITVDRELKMIELKKEIASLKGAGLNKEEVKDKL